MTCKKYLCAFLFGVGLLLISVTNSSAFVAGDVDNDGMVKMSDALRVLRHVSGVQPFYFSVELNACDVYYTPPPGEFEPSIGDSCDIIDAVIILNKAWGIMA